MADYDSSLPVRTEAAGDVDIFVSDATTPTQKLKVNADGSIDTNFATGSKIIVTDGTDDLEVNADGSINAVVSATDLDVRDLDASQDNVAISDGTDTLAVNADGSINSVVTATDLDIRDLVFATDKVDVSNSSNVGVVATDLDIRDLSASQDNVAISDGTDTLAINSDGSINVKIDADQAGDEIIDFQTSASIAKNASVNHDYTVSAGKTFIGEEAWVSGSGKLKVELLVNGSTNWVGFNSTANPNIRIPLERIVKASAAQVVRFTITNRDNQAQDLYSTLTGVEV